MIRRRSGSTTPIVVQIVNGGFGQHNSMGARALHIARAWQADSGLSGAGNQPALVALARGASRAVRKEFPVFRCGLGSLGTRALSAIKLYLWHSFDHKWLRDRAFHRSVQRRFNALDPSRLNLVHSWVGVSEEVLRLGKRVPGLVTLYDTSMIPTPDQVRLKLYGFQYFLSPSSAVTRGLIDSGVTPDRIFEVPFGVDVDRFRPAAVGPPPDAQVRVAFTGQIAVRKGIPELLSAWRSISLNELKPGGLCIGGAQLHLYGRVYPEVRSLVSQALDHRVTLNGFVDLTRRLPENQVYVLPSHREGSAKSVYEALACGMPVITTEEAGSVVRDGIEGFIVPAGDGEALAERLRRLISDPALRAAMGTAARARAEQYTWEHYGISVVEVYRALLKRHG